ncbi:Acetylcholinesterase-1 [Araneus ventricosus]|uniref:Acetylcholinesterase-1 n=1 Tax=Araneus ventricosus TaxID=182803 RepID=A0A4Y2JYV1_ARAVE|nr:Acetylcholinesterase-1 [Araneus ventricosus]
MEHRVPLLLTICQGIILYLSIGVSSDPVVQMENTTIRGKEITFEGNTVYQYLGIPYAEPPVGDLRFKKPEPLGRFPDQFDAMYPAPACRQYTETPFPWYFNDPYKSEDCLYLNTWAPADASPGNPKPVMVFMHSGNWKFGSSSIDYYSGVPLAALNGIVVVTFNYRLGVFGFLSSNTDDAPGNAGLWDIKELLEWVHKYIIYFGGDPSHLTIAGQSSSATAVGYFSLSDDAQRLYSRMIMQSGSPVNFQTDYKKQNIDLGKKLAKLVGCKEDDWDTFGSSTIQCLKSAGHFELHLNNGHLPLPFMLTVLQAPGILTPLLMGYCITELSTPIAPSATFLNRWLLRRQVCSLENAKGFFFSVAI